MHIKKGGHVVEWKSRGRSVTLVSRPHLSHCMKRAGRRLGADIADTVQCRTSLDPNRPLPALAGFLDGREVKRSVSPLCIYLPATKSRLRDHGHGLVWLSSLKTAGASVLAPLSGTRARSFRRRPSVSLSDGGPVRSS